MRNIIFFLILIILSGCAKESLPEPSFDVPSLVGKDIQGVEQILGPPSVGSPPTEEMKSAGITDWDKMWEKNGQILLVTYRLGDGRIVDYFIPTDDSSGATNEKEKLLVVGNIAATDTRYRVEFVQVMQEPGSYTGVKIIPN